jgi:hypothetical protein
MLERAPADVHAAGEGEVEGEDEREHAGDHPGEQPPLQGVDPLALDHKQVRHGDGHDRATDDQPPEDVRQAGLPGQVPLVALELQVVETGLGAVELGLGAVELGLGDGLGGLVLQLDGPHRVQGVAGPVRADRPVARPLVVHDLGEVGPVRGLAPDRSGSGNVCVSRQETTAAAASFVTVWPSR